MATSSPHPSQPGWSRSRSQHLVSSPTVSIITPEAATAARTGPSGLYAHAVARSPRKTATTDRVTPQVGDMIPAKCVGSWRLNEGMPSTAIPVATRTMTAPASPHHPQQ